MSGRLTALVQSPAGQWLGPDVDPELALHLDFALWETRAIAWSGALVLGVLGMAIGRWHWSKALGIGMMTVPLWQTLLAVLESIGPLVEGGTVLRPWSTYQLSYVYSQSILEDVGYLAAGVLIWASQGSWRRLLALDVHAIAAHVRNAGLPLGRAGTPEEVASLVAYIAGDAARYITGNVFVIDGGMTA